jgi:2-hydroxychromene-2-carboxylate isomerase
MIEIACFYSLSSPWAYFAGPKLQDIVRRHKAKCVLKPYDFQAVVPVTGGVPLRSRPQTRRNYHTMELERWSRYLGMPMVLKPKYYPQENPPPNWNKHAGWMVIAAQLRGKDASVLSHAILRALWAEDQDISDPAIRRCIADENGYDGAVLLAAEQDAVTQAIYAANSDEAIRLGVFGAPTFVVAGELFWGQDRLDFVDRKLAAMSVGL